MDAIEDLSPEEITTLSLHDVRYLLESPSLQSGTWSSDGEIRAQGLQEALLDALSNSSWTYQALASSQSWTLRGVAFTKNYGP